MALLKCPECGALVSNKEAICPTCGIPVPRILSMLNKEPVGNSPQETTSRPPAAPAAPAPTPAPAQPISAPVPPAPAQQMPASPEPPISAPPVSFMSAQPPSPAPQPEPVPTPEPAPDPSPVFTAEPTYEPASPVPFVSASPSPALAEPAAPLEPYQVSYSPAPAPEQNSISASTPPPSNGRLLPLVLALGGVAALFVILFAIFLVKYNSASSRVSSLQSELYSTESSLQSARSELSETRGELSRLRGKVSNVFPIIIDKIEIGNQYKDTRVHDAYGSKIYSSNTMYLAPRISYYGIASESNSITLKVKWYTPYGTLSTGSSSPSGFSQSESYTIQPGDNTLVLRGWGNDTKGHWDSGSYSIEIWYQNTCLKKQSFRIY